MTADVRLDGIEALVCDDIASRQRIGRSKYGTTVAENPLPLRAWLQHAYEEHLDACIYLRRALQLMDDADQKPSAAAVILGETKQGGTK